MSRSMLRKLPNPITPKHLRLRCVGVNYRACRVYRALQDLDFIDYQEANAADAGQLLQQNMADIALIPISDFALHGGYIGLDFGFGCLNESLLRLCARNPLHEIQVIYLSESASGSAFLLNVLMRQRWCISPRLVRVASGDLPRTLQQGEAVLLRAVDGDAMTGGYSIHIDLVGAWYDWIKQPFMFLTWAGRAGALTTRQHRLFREACLRATTAELQSAIEPNEPRPLTAQQYRDYVRRNYRFYFDAAEKAGMNEFFMHAAQCRLLPSCQYRHATHTLIAGNAPSIGPKRDVTEILESAIKGRRLSIREGLRVAKRAHISELGLAVEVLRARWGRDRDLKYIFAPTIQELEALEAPSSSQVISDLRTSGLGRVRLPETASCKAEWLKNLNLQAISRDFCAPIEYGLTVEEPQGGDLILENMRAQLAQLQPDGVTVLRLKVLRPNAAPIAVHVARSAQRAGLQVALSVGQLTVEDWEQRLLFFQALRSLQDESRCFESLSVEGATSDIESLIRFSVLGQLFLDNIPLVHELRVTLGPTAGVLRAAMGVQRIDLLFSLAEMGRLQTAVKFVKSLESAALTFIHHTPASADDSGSR